MGEPGRPRRGAVVPTPCPQLQIKCVNYRDVFRLLVGQGFRLTALGIFIGLVAALGLTRLMSSQLYQLSPNDPVTFATVAIVLAVVAMAACYIPSLRATRVDPMVALRNE